MCLIPLFVPLNKKHAADGDEYAQLCGHRCPPMVTFIVSLLSPPPCFHVMFGSIQRSHLIKGRTAVPRSMFDIPFFKLHQERGHLKT